MKKILMLSGRLLLLLVIAQPLVIKADAIPEPYRTISQKDVSYRVLQAAVSRLSVPSQDPLNFWSTIANNKSFPLFHRRVAVFQLFKRHVTVGTRLSKIRDLLDTPDWLHTNDLILVDEVFGRIPLDYNPNDTIIAIVVLPEEQKNKSAIYLRFQGHIPLKQFFPLAFDEQYERAEDYPVVQIGFSEMQDLL